MITTPNSRRFIAAALLLLPPALHANPKGGTVTNGAISITQGPGGTTINQSSARGIIQWQDFSIGAGEFTRFIHSTSGSATLNRVVGGIPSTINGTLQANGQVYLINPNGVLVGPNGRVNTAGFVASTLDVPDAQFTAGGDLHFSGNSIAGVMNLGTITASDGDVTLMGRTVTNAGSIHATNGTATLAAGSDILLKAAGDERVVINSGIVTGGTGAKNSGSIKAAQAKLKAAGGNAYALAVNNTGVVNATGITQKNGRIFLSSDGGVVQNSGQLIARNADGSGGSVKLKSGKGGKTINSGSIHASANDSKKNGGTVALTGDTVLVAGTSDINVSGLNAGTVAIGVSAKVAAQTSASGGIATLALGPDAQAAQEATIEAGSRIFANSTGTGDGGRVIVWSEKRSVVGGIIEAKGGDLGGNGGLVETSGRMGLSIVPGTKVSTTAPKGTAGTWLLDPAGITVDNGPAASDTANGISAPFTQNAATNHVRASDVVTALGTGNVTIQTTGFPANADIVVASPISIGALGGAHTLFLNSAGGITLNAAVGGAASDVIFQMTSHGDITVASGATVQMNGITVFAITGNISLADQITALSNKNIFLNAPNGSIAFTGAGKANASSTSTVYLDTHTTTTGTIIGTSSAAVSAGSLDIYSGTKGVSTSGSPFVVAVDNLIATVASVSQTTGGGIFLKNTSGGTLHIGGFAPLPGQPGGILIPILAGFGGVEINNTAGNFRIDSATGEHIAVPGNIKLTAGGASSDIQILNIGVNSVRSHLGKVTLIAGRNVQIGDPGTATWGINVRGQTGVTVQAGGDVTVAGSLLKSIGGSGVSVTAGGDINIVNSNGFAAIIGTSGGTPVTLTAGTGKTFNNNTLSNGGVLTTITTAADESPANVLSPGADITIYADKVALNAPVIAGTSHSVSFLPFTSSRAIDVGTKDSNKLSFTNTELAQITARDVGIGDIYGSGALAVSSPISPISPTTFMNLQLATGGNVNINQQVFLPSGKLTLQTEKFGGTVTIAANIIADSLNVLAINNGGIDASIGKISTNHLQFTAAGNATFTNAQNSIGAINTNSGDVSDASNINIVTSGSLALNGQLGTGGPGTASVILHPGANLTLNPGAEILAAQISLNISGGGLFNLAGANALGGPTANYRVWQADLFGNHNLGGLPGTEDTSTAVAFPNNPLSPNPRVFYYANVTPVGPPPPPPVTPPTTPPTATPAQTAAYIQKAIKAIGFDNLTLILQAQGYDSIQDYENKNGIATSTRHVLGIDDAAPGSSFKGTAQEFLKMSGFLPLPDVSLELQYKLYVTAINSGFAKTRPSQTDLAMMIRGGAQKLTPAQILDLSTANVWFLASNGYSAAGYKKESYYDRVSNLAAGGGVLTPAQANHFISHGPTAVKHFPAGFFLNDMFLTSSLPGRQGLVSSLSAPGAVAIVLPPILPGADLAVPPGLAPAGTKLLTQDGAGIITQDGLGLRAGKGGTLITSDGAGLIGHDGATLIGHDGATLIGHDGATFQSNAAGAGAVIKQ